MTMSWNNSAANPDNGVVANLSTAYLDASGEQDFTAGVNDSSGGASNWVISMPITISKSSIPPGIAADIHNPLSEPGNYDIHTVHASYQIPNIVNMKNFNLYLGRLCVAAGS